MEDPYAVLGVPDDADDESIRRRYLDLVRQFSPEHHAQRFAAVRAAYESLATATPGCGTVCSRPAEKENVDAILEELACRTPRRRVSLIRRCCRWRPGPDAGGDRPRCWPTSAAG